MRSFLITNPANNASKAYGDETYTYDAAGRFTDLDRNLSSTSYPTAPNPAMQRWDYKYYTGTNKLQYIDNNGTSTHLRTCTYDATGNLTADNARGITSGNYNSNHRPWGWSVSGAAYSYLYDEAGRRIYKENTSSGTPKDFYLYDHAGDLVAMANIQTTRITQYELGDLSVRPVNTNQDNYAFRVKDHLGNTRFIYRPLVCTSCTTGCTILTLDAEHMVDYFPYGKVLRENVQGSFRDRFPTTGNERDTETGLDDRVARHSDPDLGIFLGVDPLDEKFAGWAPYNYVLGNPVRLIDPNGKAPGDPEKSAGIGIGYGTGGFKFNVNFALDQRQGDFSGSYGFGLTYHSNFYLTGKRGFEFRNSFMISYDDGRTGASLGTNFWTGLGAMKEFNQRSGMMYFRQGDFNFSYENDGTPFNWVGLGDGGDSYRTAAASIGIGKFSLNMNLFTGLRNRASFDAEAEMPGGIKGIPAGRGQFGENYTNGFVDERGPRYRYGGLTLNYGGLSLGANSEWVRHVFQNRVAHDVLNSQRQFEMLSNDWKPVINMSNQQPSKFTIWGN